MTCQEVRFLVRPSKTFCTFVACVKLGNIRNVPSILLQLPTGNDFSSGLYRKDRRSLELRGCHPHSFVPELLQIFGCNANTVCTSDRKIYLLYAYIFAMNIDTFKLVTPHFFEPPSEFVNAAHGKRREKRKTVMFLQSSPYNGYMLDYRS